MLGPEYFNGVRNAAMTQMIENFKKFGGQYFDLKNRTVNISEEDLSVDVECYKRFVTTYPQYEVCFLAFTDGVMCIPHYYDTFNIIDGMQRFSYQKGRNGIRSEYSIDVRIMGAFMDAKMYSPIPDFDLFNSLIDRKELISYVLPRSRSLIDDGQLKILTDVILAVDDLELEFPQRVVVVGSSHPGPSEGGIAYDILPLMGVKGEVDLYDPYNEQMEEVVGDLKLRYHKAEYSYNFVEGDLILDDAWVDNQVHRDFDPSGVAYKYPHFSIKKFPFEYYDSGGYIYHQVFRTQGEEQRYVSRKQYCSYRPLPLGYCMACVELKFRLRQNYSSDFYEYFMNAHRVNCVTKQHRQKGIEKLPNLDEFRPVEKFELNESLFTTNLDIKLKEKFFVISEDSAKLRNSVVIVSDYRFLTWRIMSIAKGILVIDQYLCYKHGVYGCLCCVHGKCDQCLDFQSEKWFFKGEGVSLRYVEERARISPSFEEVKSQNLYKSLTNKINPKNKNDLREEKYGIDKRQAQNKSKMKIASRSRVKK